MERIMKMRRTILRGLAAWLLLAGAGCTLLPKDEPVLLPPLVQPEKETYNLYEVVRGTVVRAVRGRAVFESSSVVSHRFPEGVKGKVAKVHVQSGDTVAVGDPLIELEREEREISLLERERDVLLAQRALRQARESRDEELIRIRLLELAIAEQQRDELRAQYESSVLTAEADGVVSFAVPLKPGDEIEPGLAYLTIVDPGSVRLSYSSAATPELLEVQVGMKAKVVYNDRELAATVTQSPASAPPTDDPELSRKYARTICLLLDDPSVVPELDAAADVEIVLQRKDGVLVVPKNAIRTLAGRTFVRVLDGESIREFDIEKGLESSSGVEVVAGLEEGMQVILD
jgi:macrolide-specific efflux system membrane fusion protein